MLHAGYAASRINSALKGITKQFGWLQAAATKVSSLSITSANPATIRICDFHCEGYREFFSNSEVNADPRADNLERNDDIYAR
jgi:hypothetical protein